MVVINPSWILRFIALTYFIRLQGQNLLKKRYVPSIYAVTVCQ